MQVGLYTVYDKVAEESGPVFQAKNNDVAIRATCNLLADVNSIDDYLLYRIGTFDTDNHIIDDCDVVVLDYEILYLSQKEKLEVE